MHRKRVLALFLWRLNEKISDFFLLDTHRFLTIAWNLVLHASNQHHVLPIHVSLFRSGLSTVPGTHEQFGKSWLNLRIALWLCECRREALWFEQMTFCFHSHGVGSDWSFPSLKPLLHSLSSIPPLVLLGLFHCSLLPRFKASNGLKRN